MGGSQGLDTWKQSPVCLDTANIKILSTVRQELEKVPLKDITENLTSFG